DILASGIVILRNLGRGLVSFFGLRMMCANTVGLSQKDGVFGLTSLAVTLCHNTFNQRQRTRRARQHGVRFRACLYGTSKKFRRDGASNVRSERRQLIGSCHGWLKSRIDR